MMDLGVEEMMDLNVFEDWVRQRWEDRAHVRRGMCGEYMSAVEQRVMSIAAMGLAGETGETVEHFKKRIRDGNFVANEVMHELGDVLHYLTILTYMSGYSLEDIAHMNVVKLEHRDKEKARKERE